MKRTRFFTTLLALFLSLTAWVEPAVAAGLGVAGGNLRALAPPGSAANRLTPSQAVQLHGLMAMQSDIAFRYVPDGCYARAHLMLRKMQARGVQAGKVWAFPTYQGEALQAPGGLTWAYHVAPVVRVRYANGDFDMVLDPSLFNGPVTVVDWARPLTTAQGHFLFPCRTALGGRPVLPNGKLAAGSYTPGGELPSPRRPSHDGSVQDPGASCTIRGSVNPCPLR
jgi:hypothetical protein